MEPQITPDIDGEDLSAECNSSDQQQDNLLLNPKTLTEISEVVIREEKVKRASTFYYFIYSVIISGFI